MGIKGCIDIAWEFLRRIPEYEEDWKLHCNTSGTDHCHNPQRQTASDINAEKKWGLLRYVDPECTADNVFWAEGLSKRSFRVLLSHEGNLSIENILKKENIDYRTIILKNGIYCIKVFNNYSYFQFFVNPGSDTENIFNRYIYISLELNGKKQNTDIINDVLSNKSKCSSLSEDNQFLLRIMDKLKKSYSQREIASHLFGQEMVDNEWTQDSWLRSNIRYRIKKVNDIISQGYLNYI